MTLKRHIPSILQVTRNLNGHAHFLDLVSSCFNPQFVRTYFPPLSQFNTTKAFLLLLPMSNLNITMQNPSLLASFWTQSRICSRQEKVISFVNCGRTSTVT